MATRAACSAAASGTPSQQLSVVDFGHDSTRVIVRFAHAADEAADACTGSDVLEAETPAAQPRVHVDARRCAR